MSTGVLQTRFPPGKYFQALDGPGRTLLQAWAEPEPGRCSPAGGGSSPCPRSPFSQPCCWPASPCLPAWLCTGAETDWISPAEEAFPPCACQPWASSSSSLAHPSNQEGIQGRSRPPAIALTGRRPPAHGCSSPRGRSLWQRSAGCDAPPAGTGCRKHLPPRPCGPP